MNVMAHKDELEAAAVLYSGKTDLSSLGSRKRGEAMQDDQAVTALLMQIDRASPAAAEITPYAPPRVDRHDLRFSNAVGQRKR